MKRIVLLFLFSIITLIGFSQHIKRKGSLGVGLKQASENSFGGVLAIGQVFPNSTAAQMGLKVDDIILSIDGITLNGTADISRSVGKFKEDNRTSIELVRSGQKLTLSGNIIAPPLQSHNASSEIVLGEVPFREGYIRSIVNKPKGEGPFKAVYFIQGYPCGSTIYPPQSSITQFINGLVDKGYAVFRVEKPGVGEYHNVAPCMSMTFEDELEGFKQGYSELVKLDYVDKDNIYLFGMSLGGNVAPLLAQEYNPAGTMVYGTLVKPWEDYALEMVRYSNSMIGDDIVETEDHVYQLKDIFRKLYRENMPLSGLNPEERQLLVDYQELNENDELINRSFEFWKSLNKRNFIKEWTKVKTPVLAIYGEMDIHAISGQDSRLLVGIVNKTEPGSAEFKLLDKTNHFMAKIDTREEEYENAVTGNSFQHSVQNYNPEIVPFVDNWIKGLGLKEANELFRNASKDMPQSLTGNATMDVETADLDNDGDLDLVLATEFGENLLLINENGVFKKESVFPNIGTYTGGMKGEDSEDIAILDVNKDGLKDILFVSEDTDMHELYINMGGAVYSPSTFQMAKFGDANAVMVYDFNQDGRDDVLLGIRGRNEVFINDDGVFKEKTNDWWGDNKDSTQDLKLADIDNDGDLDIIEGIEDGGNNIYINNKGKFEEENDRLPDMGFIETRKVVTGDIDMDGDIDILYCNVAFIQGANPQNRLLLNDGTGRFEDASNLLPQEAIYTLDALIQDLDQDGDMDIFFTHFNGGQGGNNFQILINDVNMNFQDQSQYLPSMPAFGGIGLASGDFDNDGIKDIYLSNFKSKDYLLKGIKND